MTLCERIKFASAKLFIEFFGTMVLTLLFCTGNNSIILVGLWMLTIFCWKISQAQFNPAVTLAYMFRHDSKRIHFSLGILMMGAQVAGAYVGALYVLFINWNLYPMIPYTPLNSGV
jgi:glycerol uptake facilitator-like aquaporin